MSVNCTLVGARMMDEFLIEAQGPKLGKRTWTRDKLSTAQFIADQAITKLGYAEANVYNVFGGTKSDSLYTVTSIR